MRRRKYSAEIIISIVKERIENETSWERLATKYNIHHRTIEEWVIKYTIILIETIMPVRVQVRVQR